MEFRFGDLVLAVDARLLHVGCDVHLSPKAFELLKALVENYPRASPRPSCTTGCGTVSSSRRAISRIL